MLVALTILFASGGLHAEAVEVGFRGPSFAASGVSAPTGDKPQSKLWFNDGSWWGALYSPDSGGFTAHRLDWNTQTWTNTGTILESRPTGQPDVMWDGTWLYVASAGLDPSDSSDSITLNRLSYDPGQKQYAESAGFPRVIVDGGTEAVVMDKDTTGRVWLTYTRANATWVVHGGPNDDDTWIEPYVIPVSGADTLTSDDISAVVSYNANIGVMWSNQNDSTMYFAFHQDGAPDSEWTVNPAVQLPEYADDHMNLKALQADDRGQVYAATKTSLNAANAPLLLLLVLDTQGNWKRRTFSTVADNHTRPLILLDQAGGNLYYFAAAPCCGGGSIYYKPADLSNPQFEDGLGDVAISSLLDTSLNNVAGTKQTVSASTGMVVIAADDHSKHYVHNAWDLGTADTIPPDTSIISGPATVSGDASPDFVFGSNEAAVTFECSLDGGAYQACPAQTTLSGIAAGPHVLDVRAIDAGGNVDPEAASWVWTYNASVQSYPASADATLLERSPDANQGLLDDLRVDGDSGAAKRALVRFEVSELRDQPERVTIRLRSYNGSCCPIGAHLVQGAWDEATVTWNTQPAFDPTPAAEVASAPIDTWVEFDVTSVVTQPGVYDFLLATASSDGAYFWSSQAPADRPDMVITYPDATNTPPTLEPIQAQVADEGGTVGFTAMASDAESTNLTFSLDPGTGGAVPPGASIDPVSGVFAWPTLEADGPGTYSFDVVVTDDDPVAPLSDSQTVQVTVNEVNEPPVLDPLPAPEVTEGELVEFTAVASDPDLPPNSLSFSLDEGPTGASIDPATGQFSWTATIVGDYPVTVRVTDDGTPALSSTASTTITVSASVNTQPTLQPIQAQVADEGGTVGFTAVASDAESTNLTFSLDPGTGGGVPPGASIDPVSGVFAWPTIEADGPGTYSFDVVVTDDDPVAPLSDSQTVQVTVNEVNEAPVLDPLPAPEVTEGELVEFTAAASDPDLPPNSLSFSLDEGPTGASIDPSTGQFSWTATIVGDYPVTVRVTDDGTPALSSVASTTITVSATSQVVTLSPADDSYVSSKFPSSNFGADVELSSDASPTEITYLRFDLTPFESGSISTATLRMFVENRSTRDHEVWFVPAGTGWTESNITFANRPALSGLLTTFQPSTVGVWVEVDLTSAAASAAGLEFSVAIQTASSDGYNFSSKESPSNGVELVIDTGGSAPSDETPPETTITSGPDSPTTETSATFEFVADEPGATFECALDGVAFAACTSGVTYSDLGDGLHSFEVVATDQAGNVDPSPATFSWTIDTSISSITLTPVADTFFRASEPTTNFGGSMELFVDLKPEQESVVAFDLSAISGTIASATLRIFVDSATPDGPAVHLTSDPWQEATVTWESRPAAGPQLADLGYVGTGWYEIPLGSFFTGPGLYSFLFVPESQNGLDFRSREASTGSVELVLELSN